MFDDATSLIRRARTAAGLTQIQLALRARVSLSTVRLAERGLATTRTLAALAQPLGLSINDLRRTGRAADSIASERTIQLDALAPAVKP